MPTSSRASKLGRVLRQALDEAVVVRAVHAGLIGHGEFVAAQARAEAAGTSVLDEMGLDAHAVGALEAELAREALVAPSASRAEPLPPEAAAAAQDPARQIGALLLVNVIGRGGAGEVWRAWDRTLRRWVAVKLPSPSTTSFLARDRFEREAAAVARLGHPNIVPVFAAGTDGGRPYLVMPLIAGRTLAEASLSPAEAIAVMRTAALAVAHAHEQGVIHRDVKPGNIMLADDGTVIVLDFGLVFLRDDARSAMTKPGDLLGTVGYMAPEQAVGSEETHRPTVDVYGLGATLFFLVTGRPPAAARLGEAPVSLRRFTPGVSRGLDAVVSRALEPDPRHRYPTARAFADDLARVADGRGPLARPPGMAVRAFRALRRHPALAAALAGLAAVALAFVVSRARADVERTEAIEALRQVARVSVDAALRLRRAGQTQAVPHLLRPLETAYERVTKEAPKLAEPHFLMGRFWRALQDDDRALALQDLALERDPTFGPALYERAVLGVRRFARAMAEALPATHDTTSVHPAPALEIGRPALARARQDVLRALHLLRQRPLAPIDLRAIDGLVAYHEGRFNDAGAPLRAVLAEDPLREELWETLAHTAEAQRDWPAAEAAYSRAIDHDRGYLPLLLGRCQLRAFLGKSAAALEDATAALVAAPRSVQALQCRGMALAREGHDRTFRGRPADETLSAARRALDEALRVRPDHSPSWLWRGTLGRYVARARWRHGDAPDDALASSLEDLSRAAALDPAGPHPFAARGRTLTLAAEVKVARGQEPGAELDRADADLSRAAALDPGAPVYREWLGDVRSVRARWLAERGQAADEAFAAAEQDLSASAAVGEPWAFFHRGVLRAARGGHDARSGRDSLPIWAAAEADLTRALAALRDVPDVWTARAVLRQQRAQHRPRTRQALLDERAARSDLDQALRVDPRFVAALTARKHR